MNLDDMTVGQAKEPNKMFGCSSKVESAHPFVGKYVIARCYSAGVHAGELLQANGDTVFLKNSRRLWSWKAKDGIALSGVAQNGISSDGKIDVVNPEIYLTGVCELIPCSSKAKESINEHK